MSASGQKTVALDTVTGITLLRIVNGRIVDDHAETSLASLTKQLA